MRIEEEKANVMEVFDAVNGQVREEDKIPGNDVRNVMGFSVMQTMGFMASLATIGLAVFGVVFHFVTR